MKWVRDGCIGHIECETRLSLGGREEHRNLDRREERLDDDSDQYIARQWRIVGGD
jgi:hypothetical protein